LVNKGADGTWECPLMISHAGGNRIELELIMFLRAYP